MVFENVCEGLRLELAPLIGIEDFGCAVNGDGLLESLHTEVGVERVRYPVREHFAAVPVDDGN